MASLQSLEGCHFYTRIPATWFLILNSLFFIIFTPLSAKWWKSKRITTEVVEISYQLNFSRFRFFLLFAAGFVLAIALNPLLKKLMHGVR